MLFLCLAVAAIQGHWNLLLENLALRHQPGRAPACLSAPGGGKRPCGPSSTRRDYPVLDRPPWALARPGGKGTGRSVYLHKAASTGKRKKNTRLTPLTSSPMTARPRSRPRTSPITLKISATGGTRRIHSPPRTVRGEPHPGRSTVNSRNTAGATSERDRPRRPRFTGLVEGGPALALGSMPGGCSGIMA